MTADVTKALEGVTPQYLIWKQGAYYRHNSQGYTTSVIQAGRYTLADAEDITHPNGPDGPRDGMGYVHEDDVIDADWQAYQTLAAELASQTQRAEAAEAEAHACGAEREAWKSRADVAEARESALLAALEPLAAMAERYDPDEGDDGHLECWSGLAVPKIHHLRTALAKLKGGA